MTGTNSDDPIDYFNDSFNSIDEDMKKHEMNDLQKILSTYKLRPVNKSTVGFSKIAAQIHRTSVIDGFQLNLMLVGCNGLGKSTFINNLFQTQFPKNIAIGSVIESTFVMRENDVNIRLKLIEVPHFGEKINNSQCWVAIENYLDRCFEKQLQQEQRLDRSSNRTSEDHLVHLCLYFVQPNGDDTCLSDLDLEFLRSAHNKVNIVPLLAKADSMTQTEIQHHKTNLLNELHRHSINYFKFTVPEDSGWKSDSLHFKYPDRRFIQSLIERYPFAVASGNETVTIENKQVTVRSYPWGSIQIDNLDHCDTLAARTLLLSTHLQELIAQTHRTMYENYRSVALDTLSSKMGISNENNTHPALYLENYFKKVNSALLKKVNEMENGFQELSSRKQEALQKKKKDIEYESIRMSDELNYLYSKFEKDFGYFVADKTQWNCDNIEYHETCGTLKINKHGRIKPLSKSRK